MATGRQNKAESSSHCIPIKSDLNIDWEKRGISMRQLLEIYDKSAPLLIQVAESYFSNDNEYVFSSDEIFWVTDVFRLERAIVEDKNCSNISIPFDYNYNFIAIWPSGERNLYAPPRLIPLFAKIKVNVAKRLQAETICKIDRCCAMLSTVPVDLDPAMRVTQLPDNNNDYIYIELAISRIPSQTYSNLIKLSTGVQNTVEIYAQHPQVLSVEPLQQESVNAIPDKAEENSNASCLDTMNKLRNSRIGIFETVKISAAKHVPTAEKVFETVENNTQRSINFEPILANLNQFESIQSLEPQAPFSHVPCSNSTTPLPYSENVPVGADENAKINKVSQDVQPLIWKKSETSKNEIKSYFTSIREVPANVAGLTADQVASFVNCMFPRNPEYADCLKNREIDGDILIELDRSILTSECGFNKIDAIKLEKFVKNSWRPK